MLLYGRSLARVGSPRSRARATGEGPVSLHEYLESRTISASRPEPSFYALIMAAMRGAGTENALRLRMAYPEVWEELKARYNAPGGKLDTDRQED